MSIFKTVTAIVLFIFVFLSVFAGCNNSNPATGGPSPVESPAVSGEKPPGDPSPTETMEETPPVMPTGDVEAAQEPKDKKKIEAKESDYDLQFYPGAVLEESFERTVTMEGEKRVHKAAVFTTTGKPDEVRDFFLQQLDSPTVIDSGSGSLTITYRIKDLLESDEILMITINAGDEGGKTEIVMFSQR